MVVSAYDLVAQWLRSELDKLPQSPHEEGIEDWLPVIAMKRGLMQPRLAKVLQSLYEVRETLLAFRDARVETPESTLVKYLLALRSVVEVAAVSQPSTPERSTGERGQSS